MQELLLRQQELYAGEITREEYSTIKPPGRVPVTAAKGLTTMLLGERKNRASKTALLNNKFSRAVLRRFDGHSLLIYAIPNAPGPICVPMAAPTPQ